MKIEPFTSDNFKYTCNYKSGLCVEDLAFYFRAPVGLQCRLVLRDYYRRLTLTQDPGCANQGRQ